ncbi:hypothetical protein GCM10027515_26520 [Schumannella luteola]|uniref:Fibronectin type-III domain-containing protein n=1 Tax=Schumannella luteola TaxID=472059 RepID=A0A852YEH2_9MICO|nr:hypothetical protein [Schumannella luteola]NYG99551.1 hypothetical protein [Schumannella luteola]
MAYSQGFGGNGGSAFSGWPTVIYSGPIGLPGPGRAMANGSTGCLLALQGTNVSGGGASVSLAGSTGQWVGVNGGSANLEVRHSGTTNFGRGGGGSTNDGHTTWSGTIGGSYLWSQAPSAPNVYAAASPVTGQANFTFSGSTDDGGHGIYAWHYQLSYSPNFSTLITSGDTTSGNPSFSGLTPGAVVYFRVAARNYHTDAYGTVGGWSNTGAVRVLSGVRVAVGGVWKDCEVYVGVNGAWVPAEVKVGVDGQWKGLQ